jgi:hypothetical protein
MSVGSVGLRFAICPQFLNSERQGFGSTAIQHLCEMARNVGSIQLRVNTGSRNNIALTFYLSLGSVSNIQFRFRTKKDGSDIFLRLALVTAR